MKNDRYINLAESNALNYKDEYLQVLINYSDIGNFQISISYAA